MKIIIKGGKNYDSLIKANRLLDSAIKTDPSYIIAYGNKIQNLIALKEYRLALAWSDSALIIKPDVAEIITGKGMIYERLGDIAHASENYKKSSALYKSRYNSNRSLNNLRSLAFNYFLEQGKEATLKLLDKEEYRFKDSLARNRELKEFRSYLIAADRNTILENML